MLIKKTEREVVQKFYSKFKPGRWLMEKTFSGMATVYRIHSGALKIGGRWVITISEVGMEYNSTTGQAYPPLNFGRPTTYRQPKPIGDSCSRFRRKNGDIWCGRDYSRPHL